MPIVASGSKQQGNSLDAVFTLPKSNDVTRIAVLIGGNVFVPVVCLVKIRAIAPLEVELLRPLVIPVNRAAASSRSARTAITNFIRRRAIEGRFVSRLANLAEDKDW